MRARFFAITLFSAFVSMTAAGMAAISVQSGTLEGVRDLGPAPASTRVQIAVILNCHHQAELDRLVEAQADPRSHLYHHVSSRHFSSARTSRRRPGSTVASSLTYSGAGSLSRTRFRITPWSMHRRRLPPQRDISTRTFTACSPLTPD